MLSPGGIPRSPEREQMDGPLFHLGRLDDDSRLFAAFGGANPEYFVWHYTTSAAGGGSSGTGSSLGYYGYGVTGASSGPGGNHIFIEVPPDTAVYTYELTAPGTSSNPSGATAFFPSPRRQALSPLTTRKATSSEAGSGTRRQSVWCAWYGQRRAGFLGFLARPRPSQRVHEGVHRGCANAATGGFVVFPRGGFSDLELPPLLRRRPRQCLGLLHFQRFTGQGGSVQSFESPIAAGWPGHRAPIDIDRTLAIADAAASVPASAGRDVGV